LKLFQIDAFTGDAFKGNPAAVCFMDGARDDRWMTNVAAEMNLAETAFLTRADDGWGLRWFTPTVEVDLCGHATLGSAHAIWSENISSDAILRFHTRSGVLTAKHDGDMIELGRQRLVYLADDSARPTVVHGADVAAEAADESPTNSVESASPATNVRLRTVAIMSDPSTSRPRRAAAGARLYGERWLRPQTSPAALTGSRRLTGRENPRREA